MTHTFKTFLIEQEAQDQQKSQATAVAQEVKEILSPQNVAAIVAKFKVKDIDSLIEALKKHPEVRKKIQAYNKIKGKNESIDESVLGIIKGIWDYTLGPIVNWFKRSITKTLGHIFGAFATDGSFGEKALYAGMLIAMVGIPLNLLMTGAGIAVAGPALAMGGGAFFGMMWFGKNFIEPVLMRWEAPEMLPDYA